MRSLILICCCLSLLSPGCKDDSPKPRPRAYPRVEYPQRTYVPFANPECPFLFESPAYGEILEKDSACWFDIHFPAFHARLHCSYVPVKDRAEYDDLVRDAFVIANKINERANYMEEAVIHNANGVGGVYLTWTGPAASPVHFFMSDTTDHFFKGALYFDSRVQPDSLAPIATFLRQDIDHMISTFRWK